jgi:prepilin peptidase dependent protein C
LQQGFSLAEALVGMLLLALSITTLLHYQRALTLGFSQQWQQRQAWQVAQQALLGYDTAGWHTQRQQQILPGSCTLERVTVTGPHQRTAVLSRLKCHEDEQINRHLHRLRVE